MYFIKDINWLGYEEADIMLSDNLYQVRCFSHPFKNKIGDVLDESLFCLFTESVIKTYNRFDIVQNDLSYLYGVIIDKAQKILKIGEFTFLLENIPGDIIDGDFVEVVCGRIDL